MTKKLILLGAAIWLAGPAQAQAVSQVPAATAAAFKKAFPSVKMVRWEQEGSDYEAGFRMGKTGMSAVISAGGVLKETETTIAVSQLPAAVQKALAASYKGCKITEAAKIVTATTGTITYEAEVSQAGKHHDVLFNADGTEAKP